MQITISRTSTRNGIYIYNIVTLLTALVMVLICGSILHNNSILKFYFSLFPLHSKFTNKEQTVLLSFFFKEVFKSVSFRPKLTIFFLTVGVLMTAQGVIGIYSVYSKNKCMLSLFVIFTFLLTIFTVLFIGILIKYEISPVENRFQTLIKYHYGSNKTKFDNTFTKAMNIIQMKAGCCGYKGLEDYKGSSWTNNTSLDIPGSCCKPKANKTSNIKLCTSLKDQNLIYTDPCSLRIQEFDYTYILYIFTAGYILANLSVFYLGDLEIGYISDVERRANVKLVDSLELYSSHVSYKGLNKDKNNLQSDLHSEKSDDSK